MTQQNECNCDELIGELFNVEKGLVGELTNPIEYVYPELEPLHITPSGEKQHFKSTKYGYGEIEVDAVESEVLEIIPTTQDQVYEGLFRKVTVPGESNLLPENIAEGKEIFGVEGTAKTTNLKITDGYYLCYNGHRQEIAQELINLCGAITSAESMFNNCSKLTELDLSKLDTSQCTNMNSMFYSCNKLTELDVSKLDTSQCTNMYGMFYYCQNLTELDVSNFNTSNVTNMSYMFRNCEKLTELDVSNFNTSNVTNMNYMFIHCKKLTELNVSNFNTSKCTNFEHIFGYCEKLTKLDLSKWDTSNVTRMSQLFYSCESLQELDVSNFNTSNVENIRVMFYGCEKLTELDLSNWDLSKVYNCSDMFQYAYGLINLKSFKNLGKGFTQKTTNYSNYTFSVVHCYDLTHESLVDILTNGLYDLNLTYDVANGGTLYTQVCKLGSNLAKLEETEEGLEAIAQANLKGWTVTSY